MALEKLLANNLIKKDSIKRKRVGRGSGSGKGNFSGRGLKGQNARSGGGVGMLFEWGQTSFFRKLPKYKGIKPAIKTVEIVNIEDLNIFEEGTIIDKKVLKEKGLIKKIDSPVKILAKWSLNKKISLAEEIEFLSKNAEAIFKELS